MSDLRTHIGRLQNYPYLTGFQPSCEDAKLYDEMFKTAPNVAAWVAQMACYYQAERQAIAAGTADSPSSSSPPAAKNGAATAAAAADAVLAKRIEALEKRWAAIDKELNEKIAAAKKSGAPAAAPAPAAAAAAAAASASGPAPKSWTKIPGEDANVAQLRDFCRQRNLRTADFIWVDPSYYNQTLSWRRDHIKAPSMHHIVKSIFLENTHFQMSEGATSECSDRYNSRYYLVLTSYCDKLSTNNFEKILRAKSGKGKKAFNLRVSDKGAALSGYSNNAIPPLGLKHSEPIPIVISATIAQLSPPVFYAGGGHVDCKFVCDLAEFVRVTGAEVLDIAEPLTGEELAAIGSSK